MPEARSARKDDTQMTLEWADGLYSYENVDLRMIEIEMVVIIKQYKRYHFPVLGEFQEEITDGAF